MNNPEHIKNSLEKQLNATYIKIVDESGRHASHYTHPTNGPSHLKMVIVSPEFNHLSRLARQRLVYKVLGPSLKDGTLHALTFQTYTPEEFDAKE